MHTGRVESEKELQTHNRDAAVTTHICSQIITSYTGTTNTNLRVLVSSVKDTGVDEIRRKM